MRYATSIARSGSWPADHEVGTITLAHDDRHRRRIRLVDDEGEPVMLDLDQATYLRDGDALALANGYVRVIAAHEDVCDIRLGDSALAARIAWHIGNRHTPLEIVANNHLRIAWDHVLAEMVSAHGARVTRRRAPFNPEQGAYAESHQHD